MDLVKAMAPTSSRIGGDLGPDQAEGPGEKEAGPTSEARTGRTRLFNFMIGVAAGSILTVAAKKLNP